MIRSERKSEEILDWIGRSHNPKVSGYRKLDVCANAMLTSLAKTGKANKDKIKMKMALSP
jgi:hypothetical protein